MGFDLLAAEAALSLQMELPDLWVIAVIPYRNQTERWSEAMKIKYDTILHVVDDVVILNAVAVILRFLGCKHLVASMPLVAVQISRQDFLIRLVGIHCIVDRQIQSGMPGEDLGYCHDC